MARVLELIDETGEEPEATGDTATLDQDGNVTYKGTGVQAIIQKWLAEDSASGVFDNMAGWSNGYMSLKERQGD